MKLFLRLLRNQLIFICHYVIFILICQNTYHFLKYVYTLLDIKDKDRPSILRYVKKNTINDTKT